MYRKTLLVSWLILISFLYSCKTSRPLVRTTIPKPSQSISQSQVQSVNDYVNLYRNLAVSEMKRTGIPASITLAQGIIESDCGRSSLARDANNHFGIKCHDDWKGPTFRHDDNERNECFRKYPNAAESFYDHSDFLKSTPRYNFLFALATSDYKGWAVGLRRAGYATNPDYANMLIRTIEENNLWTYDKDFRIGDKESQKKSSDVKTISKAGSRASLKQPDVKTSVAAITTADSSKTQTKHTSDSTRVVTGHTSDSIKATSVRYEGDANKQTLSAGKTAINGESPVILALAPRIKENNRIKYIIVKDGETREKIENDFQLLNWELSKYNELKSDFMPYPGQILYLQPKRDKAEPGKEYCTFGNGDTMYIISQKYGIKLKRLYEMNRMTSGKEPMPGTKIWLRSTKPLQ